MMSRYGVNPHPDPLPLKGRGELSVCVCRPPVSSPRFRGEDKGEGNGSVLR